jgi:hypothetical protein
MGGFSCQRVRFHFTALDALSLPAAKASNLIRGAFGRALHETAPAIEYARLFRPRSSDGPSGFADLPRPFVFRCANLEDLAAQPGQAFWFDVHFFDAANPGISSFEAAFAAWERPGLGPGRARIRLERVMPLPALQLALEPDVSAPTRVGLRFVTPTELKSAGAIASSPEFPILFARIRDRIATLCALYGEGPLSIEFTAIGERASLVHMTRCEIEWERRERRSATTGQVHPLGGFTGEAEYEGNLAEFLPWLRAVQWAGVGRQTVWGKGEVRVIS